MLVLWSLFLVGAQLAFAHRVRPVGGPMEWWLFDLSLVVLVAVSVKLPKNRIWLAALLMGMVRLTYTTDPPVAVMAAYAWVAYFLRWVKSVMDPSGLFLRMVLALVVVTVSMVFSELVSVLRTPVTVRPALHQGVVWGFVVQSLPVALVAAGMVGLAGRVLAGLPGVGALYKTRTF